MTRPILSEEAFAGDWEKLFLRSIQQFPPRKFRLRLPSEGHRWAIYAGCLIALVCVWWGL